MQVYLPQQQKRKKERNDDFVLVSLPSSPWFLVSIFQETPRYITGATWSERALVFDRDVGRRGRGGVVGHVVSESIYFDARGCWDTTFANSYYSGTPVVYSQINTKITVWKRSNPPPVPTPVSPLTCDMPKLMLPDSFPTYIFFLSRGFETVNIPYPTLKTLVSSL